MTMAGVEAGVTERGASEKQAAELPMKPLLTLFVLLFANSVVTVAPLPFLPVSKGCSCGCVPGNCVCCVCVCACVCVVWVGGGCLHARTAALSCYCGALDGCFTAACFGRARWWHNS